MLYISITYSYFPKIFLCKGVLSRDLSMYPCNINKPMDFKNKSAAISRSFALRAPKTAANSKIFGSVHLKVLQIPGHEKRRHPQAATPETPYVTLT